MLSFLKRDYKKYNYSFLPCLFEPFYPLLKDKNVEEKRIHYFLKERKWENNNVSNNLVTLSCNDDPSRSKNNIHFVLLFGFGLGAVVGYYLQKS